jgi:hypothetical protein
MHVLWRTSTRRRFLSVDEGLVRLVQVQCGWALPAARDEEETEAA